MNMNQLGQFYNSDLQNRLSLIKKFQSELTKSENQKLTNWIDDSPNVNRLHGKQVYTASGACNFSVDNLKMWYLWASKEYGENYARKQIKEVLSSEEIEVTYIHWVSGIEIEKSICLNDDSKIVKIDDVPDCVFEKHSFNVFELGYLQNSLKPKAAMLRKCKMPFVVLDQAKLMPKINKIGHEMSSLTMLINLLSGACCYPFFRSNYIFWDQPPGIFNSEGRYGSANGNYEKRGVVPYSSCNVDIDKDTINGLVDLYNTLDSQKKEYFLQVLDRFAQAKMQSTPQDKILDLSIALEMTLLEDQSHGELTHRLSMRGAFFIGKNLDERRSIYKKLKQFYEFRSKIVHGARMKEKHLKELSENIDGYFVIAEQILNKWLNKTSVEPINWDELVLSGG